MNLLSFPFYRDKASQSRYSVAGYADAVKLYCLADRLLPFFIKKAKDGALVDCFNIYNLDDQLVHSLPAGQVSYQYYAGPDADYIVYTGALLPVVLPCGAYYLEVQGWYSEIFTAVPNVSGKLRIDWSNDTNIAGILYQTGFIQRVYLDTDLGSPVTKTDEEGETDGFGNFIPTLIRLQKFISFTAGLLPPFLADAVSALPLHNRVNIGSYQGVKEITAKLSYPANNYGLLALLNVEFAESEAVISRLCEENITLASLDVLSYTPSAWKCDPGNTDPDWKATGVTSCEIA